MNALSWITLGSSALLLAAAAGYYVGRECQWRATARLLREARWEATRRALHAKVQGFIAGRALGGRRLMIKMAEAEARREDVR